MGQGLGGNMNTLIVGDGGLTKKKYLRFLQSSITSENSSKKNSFWTLGFEMGDTLN